MSRDSSGRETNADRILAIQKLLPPAKNVTSRTGYASLDELARRLKTTRTQLIKWKNGAEPSERHRNALAKFSEGRYQPDDFRRPSAEEATREILAVVTTLEQRLTSVEKGARASVKELRGNLADLALEVQTLHAELEKRDGDAPAGSEGEPG